MVVSHLKTNHRIALPFSGKISTNFHNVFTFYFLFYRFEDLFSRNDLNCTKKILKQGYHQMHADETAYCCNKAAALHPFVHLAKGQLIFKCPFGVFKSH